MLNFCEIQHPKGNRQRPWSLVATSEILDMAFLWFFLWPLLSKKERRKLPQRKNIRELPLHRYLPFCLCEKTVSVLFGKIAAKKNIFAAQIKRRIRNFASAEATRAPPSTCDLFEKRSIKNFSRVVVPALTASADYTRSS